MNNNPPDPFEDFKPEYLSDFPDNAPEGPSMTSGLPHSREAEEAVIGSILINPTVYYDLEIFLTEKDFYVHRLRFVWIAYARLHKRQVPVDILTVSEELDDMGKLDEVGGQAYLTALLNQVPTTLHAEAYGRIVQAASVRRDVLLRANKMASLAYDSNKPIDDVLAEIDKLSNSPLKASRDTNIYAEIAAVSFREKLGKLRENSNEFAIPVFGMSVLQNAIGGFARKTVTLLYGDSSIGKTALALQIAEETAKNGFVVLYVTLESNAVSMVSRRVLGKLGLDGKYLRSGFESDAVYDSIEEEIQKYIESFDGRLIFNEEAWTVSEFNQAVRSCKPDLVIVDYLAEMTGDTSDNSFEFTKILLKNARGIKRIIKRASVNAACLMLHSMTDDAIKVIKGRDNDSVQPPLEGSLGWAKELRFIMDLGICLVETVKKNPQSPNPLQLFAWIMKDRESGNGKNISILYDKVRQALFPGPKL